MNNKKTFSVMLTTVMVSGMLSNTFGASISDFSDIPQNWSQKAIERAIENGLLNGIDGKIEPDSNLTRAQMATIVNKAFGAYKEASISQYNDVPDNAWYYSELAKAVHMGTFEGSDGRLSPNDFITREQAFSVLARALKLEDGALSSLNKFNDSGSISQWAKSTVSALVEKGYVNGSNGLLNPKGNITRAEFAQIMDSVIKEYVNADKTYSNTIDGNVMINKEGTNLDGVTIKGDLIIGDGVKDGNIKISNTKVEGRILVRGGNINFESSNASLVIVNRKDGEVKLEADKNSTIANVNTQTSTNLTGEFRNINANSDIDIDGNIFRISVSKGININVNSGTVENIDISNNASSTNIEVAEKAEVTKVTNKASNVSISGRGKVIDVDDSSKQADVATKNTKVNGTTVSKGNNSSVSYNNKDSEKNIDLVEFSSVNNLRVGETETRRIRVTPSDAKIEIKNSNDSVASATVDDNEIKITGRNGGETKITVRAYKSGYVDAEEEFKIYVENSSSDDDNYPDINLQSFSNIPELKTGEINKQEIKVTPSDSSIRIENYSPSIATAVVNNGFVEVTGVSEGQAKIRIYAYRNGYDSANKVIDVSVVDASKFVNLNDFSHITDLKIGETKSQDIQVAPEDSQLSVVSSSDAIATAKLNGKKVEVTGVSEGTAIITITASKDGLRNTVKTFNITVVPNGEIILNDFINITDLKANETRTQDIQVNPEDSQLSVVSSSDAIATAKLNGKKVEVTGLSEGTATITITASKIGYNDIIKTFTVTIIPKEQIVLNDFIDMTDLKTNETRMQDIQVNPEDSQLSVVSSSDAIAAAKLNGKKVEITGLSEGMATITVTASKDGCIESIKTFNVTVIKNEIILNDFINIAELKVNETKSQDIQVTPEDSQLSVASSSDAIATAKLNGKKVEVTGLSEGTATITVTASKDGYIENSKTFNVTVIKNEMMLNDFINIAELKISETKSQDIQVTPEDSQLSVASSNNSIATAQLNGKKVEITGLSEGTAIITINAVKNGYKDSSKSFSVTVLKAEPILQNIVLNKPNDIASINKNQTVTQNIQIAPEDAIITVQSGNNLIATAAVNNKTIQITGLSEGTTVITIKAEKQGYTASTTTFSVTVVNQI